MTGRGRPVGAGSRVAFCVPLIAALAAALLAPWSSAPSAQESVPPQQGVTGGPQIARTYDAILDARFGAIPALLRQTCPPAPADVCTLLDAVARWWRIQLDPNDTSRDAAFHARVEEAIAGIRQWTERTPEAGEAFFYLGGAYGARAQWRVLRGERLAAARDGKRIKDALERSLMLDPTLQDAYFGIGLYHYYADVAPVAAKVVRWLLLLPGGDKEEGLREMLRARDGGQLLRSEADYQLHLIYLWYEKQPDRALDLLRALRMRHPRNPHFLQRIAEVEDIYRHDAAASLRAWQALLEAARAGRVAEPALAEASAHLGAAAQLDRLNQTQAAIPHLRAVIEAQAPAPYGAAAEAHLQLGRMLDRLGSFEEAAAAYRSAIEAAPAGDRTDVAGRAGAALRARRPR
jgi:tetratricopeptide (TPR) repeat protein